MGESIDVSGLTYTYDNADQPSIKNINLHVAEDEFVALFGASGSGKSTLCMCINGLIPQFFGGKIEGEVSVGLTNVRNTAIQDIALSVSMVFQNPENQLFASTVEEELAFDVMNRGLPVEEVRRRISEVLKIVGMEEHKNSLIDELSAGQKQRIAIAGALIMSPDVIILDEPTSQLDPASAESLLVTLRQINRDNKITVLIAEQRVERILPYADRVIILENGMILANGSPREVFKDLDLISRSAIRLPLVLRFAHELSLYNLKFVKTPLTVQSVVEQLPSNVIDSVKKESNKLKVESHQDLDTPVIQVDNLSHNYPNGFEALRDISITFSKGGFQAIMGANGSGKTTFIEHLNGLLKPTQGMVKVFGIDTRRRTVAELSRNVALVFQNPDHQLFAKTVTEETEFGPKNLGLEPKRISELTEHALTIMDLQGLRDRDPKSLSYGQRQRVTIASALSMGTDVLILDEPTTGQDDQHCKAIMELSRSLCKMGKTVLLIAHDSELVAEYCDSVSVLSESRMIANGPPREIFYDKDILSRASLKPPQIVQLSEALGLESNPIRLDELVNMFIKAIKR